MKHGIIGCMLLSTPLALLADGTPWLSNPGDTNIQMSLVYQEADEYWVGNNKVELADDITQTTVWLAVNHGLTDDLAVDFRTGYAQSEYSFSDDQEDITDTTVGLTWRFHDEFLSDGNAPSAAFRIAATIEGDYDTGSINSIGDGASGAETSLLLGKAITSRFAIAGELGYRYRSSNVPNEVFANINAYYIVTPNLSFSAGYHQLDSLGDLDISDPGFTPRRLPEAEEDIESLIVGLAYNITQSFNVSMNYGSVIDGRNTSDNDITSLSVGFLF